MSNTSNSSTSNFDFNAFNAMTERKPAGLQVFLAQQLLSNALWSMQKYDNPSADDVEATIVAIKAIRADLKEAAAARAKKAD